MQELNIFRDWDRISWKDSLWFNFMRAICFTPVAITFFTLNGASDLTPAFFWPIIYFFCVLIFLTISPILNAAGGPLAPIMWAFFSLIFVSAGDPIVFLISKIKPDLVPVQNCKFIYLRLFVFVLKPENISNGQEKMIDSDY